MAKQAAPLEFNSLSGGFITEANALTFPDSASLDEVNFELTRDGSRKRRLGLEYEPLAEFWEAGYGYGAEAPSVVASHLWKNVAGNPETELLVVQQDNKVAFYRTGSNSISPGRLPLIVEGPTPFKGNSYGFANIDGTLVIVTGGPNILTITGTVTSTGGVSLSDPEESRLTMRDLFGVSVPYNKAVEGATPSSSDLIDLNDPVYVTKRPWADGLPTQEAGVVLVYTASTTNAYSDGLDYGATNVFALSNFSPASIEGFSIARVEIRTSDQTFALDFDRNGASPSFHQIDVTIGGILQTLSKVSDYSYSLVGYTGSSSITSFSVNTIAAASYYNYNLRNQSFAFKRLPKTGSIAIDPIQQFFDVADKFPSMGDTVQAALYNNLDAVNKTVERFHAEDLLENPQGSYPASKGFFIIDALDRAASRKEVWEDLIADQGYPTAELDNLPPDATPGGASAIAEYGGRVWYGGFSEQGTGTEKGGIRLESFLLYSQLANSKSVLTRCYQEGDPTSIVDPELLNTDGGFLSLDGAYGIQRLVPLGNSLLAFSENGIWAVSGSDGNYFTPTTPRIQKITDRGSISPTAIVVIDTAVMFWAKDGIYLIGINQTGSYEVKNLTETTVQSYYDEIPYISKRTVVGAYDSYKSQVVWSIYNTVGREMPTELLILLTTSGAFTRYVVGDGVEARTVVGPISTPPFTIGASDTAVLVVGDAVLVGEDGVVTAGTEIDSRTTDVKYAILNESGSASALSFATFTNAEYKDWGEVDAPAYMVTGYVHGGDHQRYKQVPYITFHFERTEDGFTADAQGDLYPDHASGCLVQAQWDWANSVNSGRWGREFQAYRYRKQWMPADANDPYDNGFSTIVTKNRIRGKGRVLSLKISTEEGKDCRILGWSAIMGVNGHV